MPRNALLVEITPEDEQTAVEADQWNCLIVRAVQRKLPQALRVHANDKHIEFTLPEDGPTGTRYVCDTPPEVIEHVIKPFDLKQPIADEWRTFSIVAREAHPVQHNKHRATKNAWQRKRRAVRAQKSQNVRVHTYGRFIDSGGDA